MATAATAKPTTIAAQGDTVDLTKPETFRGLTLTSEQLYARLAILSHLEEELDAATKELSPKSKKELGEIVNLTEKDKNSLLHLGPIPIHRLQAPYYYVQMKPTKVDIYKQVRRQIAEIPRKAISVLQAVQPMAQANWFQTAIFAQTESVLSSDFMDALNATLMGNMCLLRASMLLMAKPDLFREVLGLYSSSNNLYNAQISHNRQFEAELLEATEALYKELQALNQQIEECCGETLEESPRLADVVQAYRVREAEVIASAEKKIVAHCGRFLDAINQLIARAEDCVSKITAKNEKVKEALTHMTQLLRDQNSLAEQRALMQAEYEAFKNAKQKEVDSVKVTDKKSELKILYITWYSRIKTEVTENDFHSKEFYNRYLALQLKEASLLQAIKNSKDILVTAMSGVVASGDDQNSLKDSMQALAASIFCVNQLAVALQQRQRQAQDQIATCERILKEKGRISGIEDARVDNVLAMMEDRIEKTIRKQALWLASHRQTFTLQSFQRLEANVRAEVILVLSPEGGGDITKMVNQATRLITSYLPNNMDDPEQVHSAVKAQLVPYKKMLQLTEGVADTDQKV